MGHCAAFLHLNYKELFCVCTHTCLLTAVQHLIQKAWAHFPLLFCLSAVQGGMEALELQKDVKEESDEEEDDDEESGRLRFKTERKEGTIIRLSDVTRERRNIPETLGNVSHLSHTLSTPISTSSIALSRLAKQVKSSCLYRLLAWCPEAGWSE